MTSISLISSDVCPSIPMKEIIANMLNGILALQELARVISSAIVVKLESYFI